MGNDWFHEYFINELKAIGRKPTSNMQHEVVDSLPSSGNEQTIYFVKSDSGSSNNNYDEYVWISSSSSFEKIGSTQIDGSTTQPDWNQNDATQPDYVKNRPFYTGDPVETALIEESTVSFAAEVGMYIGQLESTFLATVGETYKVYWDGTAYECACVNIEGTIVIGNLSIIGEGADSGEPFLMAVLNGRGISIYTADTSASHTFSISRMVTQIVKIDPKYLFQPDWNQNDETAPDYVKNRPFYTGYTEEKTLIKESTVMFEANGDSYRGSLRSTFTPIVGETYKVSWDGTVYESVCLNVQGKTVIGNLSIIGVGSNTGEPFLIAVDNQIYIHTLDTASSHVISVSGRTTQIVKINEEYLPILGKPEGKSYLTFSSPNEFTLIGLKRWDGTLEYFTPDNTWTTWDGDTLSAVLNGGEYALYLRGTGNSIITGGYYSWRLDGTDIKCIGNIENLLDYATVESGNHPIMSSACYRFMFKGCTSLTQAPTLPATTLAEYCYGGMFKGCTSLTQAPTLPATTLAGWCYNEMFNGCTNLKLSSTKTDEYMQEYRIPSSGNGVTASSDLSGMFIGTGGTFTGTPSINTTYYLSSDNMVVRETEIATLNGYVGSMINNAISEHADTAEYIIHSSTSGSTKKFKITVDDTGTLSATEVT